MPTVTGSCRLIKTENAPTEYFTNFIQHLVTKENAIFFKGKKCIWKPSGEEGVHGWGKGKIRLTWVIEMIQAGKFLGLLLASSEIIQ